MQWWSVENKWLPLVFLSKETFTLQTCWLPLSSCPGFSERVFGALTQGGIWKTREDLIETLCLKQTAVAGEALCCNEHETHLISSAEQTLWGGRTQFILGDFFQVLLILARGGLWQSSSCSRKGHCGSPGLTFQVVFSLQVCALPALAQPRLRFTFSSPISLILTKLPLQFLKSSYKQSDFEIWTGSDCLWAIGGRVHFESLNLQNVCVYLAISSEPPLWVSGITHNTHQHIYRPLTVWWDEQFLRYGL